MLEAQQLPEVTASTWEPLEMMEEPQIRLFGQLDTPPCLEAVQAGRGPCCTCLCPVPPK